MSECKGEHDRRGSAWALGTAEHKGCGGRRRTCGPSVLAPSDENPQPSAGAAHGQGQIAPKSTAGGVAPAVACHLVARPAKAAAAARPARLRLVPPSPASRQQFTRPTFFQEALVVQHGQAIHEEEHPLQHRVNEVWPQARTLLQQLQINTAPAGGSRDSFPPPDQLWIAPLLAQTRELCLAPQLSATIYENTNKIADPGTKTPSLWTIPVPQRTAAKQIVQQGGVPGLFHLQDRTEGSATMSDTGSEHSVDETLSK